MPVHDLGYRAWLGKRMPRVLRPWVVAKSGIALVWRRKWLRFMILLAWLPIVVPTVGIFAFEFSSADPDLQNMIGYLLKGFDEGRISFAVYLKFFTNGNIRYSTRSHGCKTAQTAPAPASSRSRTCSFSLRGCACS